MSFFQEKAQAKRSFAILRFARFQRFLASPAPRTKHKEVGLMRAYIATGILGSFAFDGSGKSIVYRLFPKKPDEIAQRLKRARKGDILPEEREIARELEVSLISKARKKREREPPQLEHDQTKPKIYLTLIFA